MKQALTFGSIAVHLWIQLILLGSIFLDTFMVYPNIFHNIPASFDTAMDFMAVASPGTFFPPLGFLSIVSGAAAVVFSWNIKHVRYWILSSMLMIILEGVSSILFAWPRNEIMFVEGSDMHSTAILIQTAREFLVVHGFRVACNIAGSILIYIGFLRYYQWKLTSDRPSTKPGA
ncbi:hypothetical protein [Salibacterium aidingense]|uniref:hypothetical protein n=1 Tax=Salibacterium aidingense TaxID=384933 RepID=UPI003BEA4D41